eukprot:COSAG01_NODE_33568_length_562_cov_0.768898_2_plen_95_part_00
MTAAAAAAAAAGDSPWHHCLSARRLSLPCSVHRVLAVAERMVAEGKLAKVEQRDVRASTHVFVVAARVLFLRLGLVIAVVARGSSAVLSRRLLL